MPALQGANRENFSGGMNAVASPWHLRPNEVLRAINFILDEDGALNVRDGSRTVEMAPEGIQGVLTLNSFNLVDGTDVPLAVGRNVLTGTQQLYNRTSGGWTLLGDFQTLFDIPQIIPWLNVGIVAAGYETPWYTDGSSFAQFAGMDVIPGAQHLVVHQNALWAWNTAPSTSTYDGPSSLRQSDVENFNSWPTSNQLFLSKDDGQVGMGIAVYTVADTGISPQDFLVVFKTYSGYLVQGAFGGGSAPTFTRIKSNMGCVAPRTIQFCTGPNFQGLIRLSHRGFALFNGLNDTVISDKIRPYIFGHDDVQGLTWSQIGRSVATQVHNPPLYVCACPVVPSGNLTRVFIYDLIQQAWTICTFPVPFATVNLILDDAVQPYVLAGEAQGPRVLRLFDGDTTDDGAAPAFLLRLPPVGKPLQRYYYRRLLLKLFRVLAHTRFTARFVVGPGQSRIPQTKVCQLSVGANAVPGSPFVDSAEVDANFDVGLTGEALYTEITGSGMVSIRAASFQVSPKPLTRPVRV